MKNLTILQRGIPEYRVEFFNRLDSTLSEHGIRLRVIAAEFSAGLFQKNAIEKVHCARRVPLIEIRNSFWLRKTQPWLRNSDLVIIPQELRFLNTYPIVFRRPFGIRTAYFGHGRNLQAVTPQPMIAKLRANLATRVDWWFAYTAMSKEIVESYGFPSTHITVVDNAIDTRSITERRAELSDSDIRHIESEVFPDDEINEEAPPTGVFCGRLGPLKWIPFLLESLELIRRSVPTFRMIVVGDGSDSAQVRAFCAEHRWCVHTGAIFDLERVAPLALGDVWLNPGMVGLAILDAYALGMPVVTTDNEIHSPEVAYLRSGFNGLMTRADPAAYAEGIVNLLNDPSRLQKMKHAARDTAATMTLGRMVDQFAMGIRRWLAAESPNPSHTES